MKKEQLAKLVSVSLCLMLVTGCMSKGDSDSIIESESSNVEDSFSETSGWKPSDETYTITFMSNDVIVKTYENVSYGEYVDIPTVTSASERYTLTGWKGMDDADFKAGKVKVFESDATYTAIWTEQFGTNNVYETMRRKSDMEIVIDGLRDDAYEHNEAIDVNVISTGTSDVTAKTYTMWDESNLYVLVEVNDSTYTPYVGGNLVDADSVKVYIDLLHNDSICGNEYVSGWGQPYRGEPGPMCEGLFHIGAGISYPNENGHRYGYGSEFMFNGWLSNAAKESGNTVGTTVATENGYNVEYRIDCTHEKVPAELRLHKDQNIGIGINVFDRNEGNTSIITLEDINKEMDVTPKRLSNFKLIANPLQDRDIYGACKVREGYKVNSKQVKDNIFADAREYEVSGVKFSSLWDENGLYSYYELGEGVTSLEVSSPNLTESVTLTASGKVSIPFTSLTTKDLPLVTLVINGDEENKVELAYELTLNGNNHTETKYLFEADYLEETETITIDGEKDEAYAACQEITVATNSLVEQESLAATGKAYIKWDNDNIYVFVDVTDANVDSTTVNESSPEKNDGVEIWLSTCQTLPTTSTKWGWPTGGTNSNRPTSDYCGEGKFAIRAGNPESATCGEHWMWDNPDLVNREMASKLTETGYTAEFCIGWGTFKTAVTDKLEEIIDIGININDGENNSRKGVVTLSQKAHDIWVSPGNMDHVMLVNK